MSRRDADGKERGCLRDDWEIQISIRKLTPQLPLYKLHSSPHPVAMARVLIGGCVMQFAIYVIFHAAVTINYTCALREIPNVTPNHFQVSNSQ